MSVDIRPYLIARQFCADPSDQIEVTTALSALAIGIRLAFDHPDEARRFAGALEAQCRGEQTEILAHQSGDSIVEYMRMCGL